MVFAPNPAPSTFTVARNVLFTMTANVEPIELRISRFLSFLKAVSRFGLVSPAEMADAAATFLLERFLLLQVELLLEPIDKSLDEALTSLWTKKNFNSGHGFVPMISRLIFDIFTASSIVSAISSAISSFLNTALASPAKLPSSVFIPNWPACLALIGLVCADSSQKPTVSMDLDRLVRKCFVDGGNSVTMKGTKLI